MRYYLVINRKTPRVLGVKLSGELARADKVIEQGRECPVWRKATGGSGSQADMGHRLAGGPQLDGKVWDILSTKYRLANYGTAR